VIATPFTPHPDIAGRSLLTLRHHSPDGVAAVLDLAAALKDGRAAGWPPLLRHQVIALIFERPSTRTRVSFVSGIERLGGSAMVLSPADMQLGRGETIEDTAQVLSRFVHGLIVRTFDHSEVERLSTAGSVPVINALTDFLHPCQIYADAFTMTERWAKGTTGAKLVDSLRGRKIAFLGDTACNMANSWILGANLFGMKIALAGPKDFAPTKEFASFLDREGYGGGYDFTTDPYQAVRDADVVYTDVWVSMGKEEETKERIKVMSPYAVSGKLFAAAKKDALFMHCLPAHAGEEVMPEVLASPRSIIFDEAENRLHMQKAILASLAARRK
jgi:ornithine carbamoyltransferase